MTTPIRAGQIIRAKGLNARVEPGTEHLETIDLASQVWHENIPQDFRHLYLVLNGGLDADGTVFTDLGMRVNHDSTGPYNGWRFARLSDDTPDNQFDSGLGSIHVATWGGVTSRNTATITIANYTRSEWHSCHSVFTGVRGGGQTAGNHVAGTVWGDRRVSEPINAVGFFVIGGGNEVAAGTTSTLYGLR